MVTTVPNTPLIVPRQIRGFGWRPDLPDFRDYPLSKAKAVQRLTSLPARASIRDKMSPVRDQGSLGSCVGFSACAAVEYLRNTDQDLYSTIYSSLWLYYEARIADGEEWANVDAGAYVRDAVKVLTKYGVPPESKWRYEKQPFDRKPILSTYKEAARWKLGAYHRCYGLDDVKKALAAKMPVIGGFSCYSSMFTAAVDKSGKIPMPSRYDQLVSGHAICLAEYDDSTSLITFKNHWDDVWGDAGYGFLPYPYVGNANLSDDWWALAAESPETTPWED